MTLGPSGYAKLYAVALAVFLLLDLVWLGVVARSTYVKHLGSLMREQVQWPAALLFYAFFVGGMIVFVIAPAVEADSLQRALALGALFGFITYQTYELTNYAMVKGWPLPIVFIDIAWGVLLSAAVSGATFAIGKRWLG